MRRVLGVISIMLAGLIGIVEYRVIIDPVVADSVRNAFADHDPFPRLPWDYHVIFVLLFIGLLSAGLRFVFRGTAQS